MNQQFQLIEDGSVYEVYNILKTNKSYAHDEPIYFMRKIKNGTVWRTGQPMISVPESNLTQFFKPLGRK